MLTKKDSNGRDADRGSRGPPRRILPALLPALILVAISLWEVRVITRAGSDVPDARAWAAAAAAVRAEHSRGDLIVFAPRWIDPVGRHHLGDLMTVDMAARSDAAGYGTIWELSCRGDRAPETRGLDPVWQRSFGTLIVRRFERAPDEVITDFVAILDRAQVSGPSVGRPRVVLTEVGFEPHRCIQVEPAAGHTVSLTYGGVALGSRVVGYVGLADIYSRREIREPGRLELVIDGAAAAAVRFGVDDGWVRFAAPTEPGQARRVDFRATAVGAKARLRWICFAAEARK